MRQREWFKGWRREARSVEDDESSAGQRRARLVGRVRNFWRRDRAEDHDDPARGPGVMNEAGPLSHGLF